MLIKRLSVLAIVCAMGFVPARSFGQAFKDADREQAVLKAQSELFTAQVQGDMAAMDRLFIEDYTHTHASGLVQSKAEFTKPFKPGVQRYTSFEVVDSKVRFYSGAMTALIVGHIHINTVGSNMSAAEPDGFLEVWVNDKGAWRCAAVAISRPPAKK